MISIFAMCHVVFMMIYLFYFRNLHFRKWKRKQFVSFTTMAFVNIVRRDGKSTTKKLVESNFVKIQAVLSDTPKTASILPSTTGASSERFAHMLT